MSTSVEKVIVDVDLGFDDYLALVLLLHAEKLGQLIILAIICTTANTKVDHVTTNVVRLLELVNRTDIPVYRGTSNPLIPLEDIDYTYFGNDGFCDLTYDRNPDLSVVKTEPAATAIARLAAENPGEINLITLAALTNVALATKFDDGFGGNLKSFWCLGGNYQGGNNLGDMKAEFNYYVDPEAVFMFFDAFIDSGNNTEERHILPFETTEGSTISLDFLFTQFGVKQAPEIQLFMRAAEKFYRSMQPGVTSWIPYDAFAVASFLDRTLIMVSSVHNVSIELSGRHTRGQMLLDLVEDVGKLQNVEIIQRLDVDKFKDTLLAL